MFEEARQHWQRAAAEFLKTVENIPYELRQQPGACGTWSVQQVVAHLAGWQREALRRYGDCLAGDTTSRTYDLDAFNASSVAALKLLNWYETLDTFRFTVEDLNQQAQQLTAEQISQTPVYEEWLTGIGNDLVQHTTAIQAWLATQEKK